MNITYVITQAIRQHVQVLFGKPYFGKPTYRFLIEENRLIKPEILGNSLYVHPYNQLVADFCVKYFLQLIQGEQLAISIHTSNDAATLCVRGSQSIDLNKLAAELYEEVNKHFGT